MSNERPIEIDVLIIGGGIQGLWMLDRVILRGYSAVLLERRLLGSQQTCHSHVYIHQGHVYSSDTPDAANLRNTDEALLDRLQIVGMAWDAWLNRSGVSRGHGPSYFGFGSEARLVTLGHYWNDIKLTFKRIATPDLFAGGFIEYVCETSEATLDGSWLVREMCQLHEGCIGRIYGIERIVVPNLPARITVEVSLREHSRALPLTDADRRVFSARAVILAAGAGNDQLLWLARNEDDQPLQGMETDLIIRKGHMLAIWGPKKDLPPLTGVFPDVGQLFIVSRQTETETVWLISDGRSPDTAGAAHYVGYDTSAWLPDVIKSLKLLAPKYFKTDAERSRWAWGVYDAPKAEQAYRGEGHRKPGHLEQLAGTGLFVILPTKLTLAPLMSHEVIIQLAAAKINHSHTTPPSNTARAAGLEPVVAAEERWRRLARSSWEAFRAYHMIS